jgi:hypothetical protein
MKRRWVLGALSPMLTGGCLRLEGGAGTSTQAGTGDGDETTTPSTTASGRTTTTPQGLVVSAEMTDQIGSGTGGEITIRLANNAATAFDGEVLLLFDRAVHSTQPVGVDAGGETTTAVSVDALDVGERRVTVEVRSADVREVVFDRSLGTAANPVTLEWGTEYSPPGNTRGRSYICTGIAVESPTGTLGSYNVGGEEDGISFYAGTYRTNPERRQTVNRWLGGGDRGTVMAFEDVDLRAATTLRLRGHLPDTLDSMPVVCRMGGLKVAEVTWERDGEHTVPLTLFD